MPYTIPYGMSAQAAKAATEATEKAKAEQQPTPPPFNMLTLAYTNLAGERCQFTLKTEDADAHPVEVLQQLSEHMPVDERTAMRIAFERLEKEVRAS